MKCIHGKEIEVRLEFRSNHLEDGFFFYTEDGILDTNWEGKYFRINGCNECNVIKVLEV